jgi:hypothetical protein
MAGVFQLCKLNEMPLGLKIIGLFNIIMGIILIYSHLFVFTLGVFLGYVDYSTFNNIGSLLLYIIVFRLALALFCFSVFLLFFSGIDIFIGDSRAKKMIIISTPIIILSLAYGGFVYFNSFLLLALISYLVIMLVYVLYNNNAVNFFRNKGTRLNLKAPFGILFFLYLLGFWLGKIFFN